MKPPKRLVSIYIDCDLYDDILALKKEDDSFNKIIVALVRQSLKERERKRKKNATKEVHS